MKKILVIIGLLFYAMASNAGEMLKPYVLASVTAGMPVQQVVGVKNKLESAGFEIVGEYTPYSGATILAVTNDAIKKIASASEFGGFGAVVRVSLAAHQGKTQISYTTPEYWAAAFHMSGDVSGVTKSLASALGAKQNFGSASGMTDADIRDYHYMFSMPYFKDMDEIASFADQGAAIAAVEKSLADNKSGIAKVYRVDIPGKKQTVFGVALESGNGADAKVMPAIDAADLKQLAHLPYELLVSDGKAYALAGKYRIAIAFPDLSMGSFLAISDAPDGIVDSLKVIAK